MTRGNLEFRIGCVVLAAAAVGCASNGQDRRGAQTTSSSSGSSRQPVNVVTAAADIANSAVGAAAGAVNGAINGAIAGANAGASRGATTTRQRVPRIKRNGRGGYDASELQQDALRRAHAMADRYGTIDRSRPAPRPTRQPVNR